MKIVLVIALFAIGGISAARPRRAVGGKSTSSQMSANLVSIRIKKVHACSGVLISNQIVLTPSHCVVDDKSKRRRGLSVKTATSLEKGDDRRYNIQQIVLPGEKIRKWRVPSTTIAALILSKKIPSTETVETLALPQKHLKDLQLSMDGNSLVAKLVAFNSEDESAMKQLHVEIDPSVDCSPIPDLYAVVYSPKFCGRALDGELSNGDIGSPLIYNEVLIGLVAGGKSNEKNDAYLDTYEYGRFVADVLFGRWSTYDIL